MLDIKAHKPKKNVPIFEHECEKCQEQVYAIKETATHKDLNSTCDGRLVLLGSFSVVLEYGTQNEIIKLAGKDWNVLAILKSKLKGWSGLQNNEKAFEFNQKNLALLYEAKPALVELLAGLCAQRTLFGLVDLGDFAKNSNGQSSIQKDTREANHSRQIAESASQGTSN